MSLSFDVQKPKDSLPTAQYDVVVMGAGPYGLSASAHLRARGLKLATFGKSNYFWRNYMVKGMMLRSYWWASSLSDPAQKYSIKQYFAQKKIEPTYPLPVEIFNDYCEWFQKNAVPDLDETYIAKIERKDNHFLVTLEDDRVVESKLVVVAPGLEYYVYCPPEYEHMPSSLVSHTANQTDMSAFAGKRVAMIGRGQAALEYAALLHESGAQVCVICRNPIKWYDASAVQPEGTPALIKAWRSFRSILDSPPALLGGGWDNLFLQTFPYVGHSMPYDLRNRLFDSHHGPAAVHWVKERVVGYLPLKEQVQVTKVEAVDNDTVARLTLSNGEVVDFDHIMLGTGYRADVRRLPMLDASLLNSIALVDGFPILNSSFESNIPGLYFVGYTSLRSFGPFFRFVAGVDAAARRLSKAVARQVVRSR